MPPLSTILRWLDAHGAYLLALAPALVVAWKAMPAATRAALEARFPRATGLVRFVAAVAPDLIGAGRVLRHQIVAGEARPGVTPPAAVPPQPIAPTITQTVRDVERGGTGVRGFARLDAAALTLGVGALCFAAAVLAGCKSFDLPEPVGCTYRDTRCAPDGIPETCSTTGRWTRGVPALPCPGASVCCRTTSPWGRALHACAPQSACLPETPSAAPDAGAEAGAL